MHFRELLNRYNTFACILYIIYFIQIYYIIYHASFDPFSRVSKILVRFKTKFSSLK